MVKNIWALVLDYRLCMPSLHENDLQRCYMFIDMDVIQILLLIINWAHYLYSEYECFHFYLVGGMVP